MIYEKDWSDIPWWDAAAIVRKRQAIDRRNSKPKQGYKSPVQKRIEKDNASMHNRFYCEYSDN